MKPIWDKTLKSMLKSINCNMADRECASDELKNKIESLLPFMKQHNNGLISEDDMCRMKIKHNLSFLNRTEPELPQKTNEQQTPVNTKRANEQKTTQSNHKKTSKSETQKQEESGAKPKKKIKLTSATETIREVIAIRESKAPSKLEPQKKPNLEFDRALLDNYPFLAEKYTPGHPTEFTSKLSPLTEVILRIQPKNRKNNLKWN